ncbi:MAG: gamma-glutamyl-gamma-aminobutyrate hydrolase family protein [Pseudomonadota bacterium]
MSKPMVVVTGDLIDHSFMKFSATPASYCEALALVGLLPVQLPTIAAPIDPSPLLDAADGVLVTGARSNVHPPLYGAPETEAAAPFDRDRDRIVLPLIREAVARGIPLFAICRGIQELNVAFGGTLRGAIHRQENLGEHWTEPHRDLDERFGLRHQVTIAPGGILAEVFNDASIAVNSVHQQAVDRLAPRARVEASAADGVVEAISIEGAQAFALGVQWHPEHLVASDPASRAVFDAFAEAVNGHAAGMEERAA